MAGRRLSTTAKWVSVNITGVHDRRSLGNVNGLQMIADEEKHTDGVSDMI